MELTASIAQLVSPLVLSTNQPLRASMLESKGHDTRVSGVFDKLGRPNSVLEYVNIESSGGQLSATSVRGTLKGFASQPPLESAARKAVAT